MRLQYSYTSETVWWYLSLYFGSRARSTNKVSTKTRRSREQGHQGTHQPKLYATNTERCPVRFSKKSRCHRPVEMNTPESLFHLAVRYIGAQMTKFGIWRQSSVKMRRESFSPRLRRILGCSLKESGWLILLSGKPVFQGSLMQIFWKTFQLAQLREGLEKKLTIWQVSKFK